MEFYHNGCINDTVMLLLGRQIRRWPRGVRTSRSPANLTRRLTTMTIAQPRTVPNSNPRELRALELYRTRGHEIRHVGQDLYLVPSCTGRGFYSVDYREETCDCPDHEIRGENCKHILAVGIYHAKHRKRS